MWYAHATSRKSVIRVHPSIQCRFTHFCPSDALESTQIGPKLSEKLSSLWWERKWRSRVMQAPIDCFRKLINFSQYIMTRKLSRTPQKCSTSKARRIPPASLTGISLIPSETCFRPVREAGYEPKEKGGLSWACGASELCDWWIWGSLLYTELFSPDHMVRYT